MATKQAKLEAQRVETGQAAHEGAPRAGREADDKAKINRRRAGNASTPGEPPAATISETARRQDGAGIAADRGGSANVVGAGQTAIAHADNSESAGGGYGDMPPRADTPSRSPAASAAGLIRASAHPAYRRFFQMARVGKPGLA